MSASPIDKTLPDGSPPELAYEDYPAEFHKWLNDKLGDVIVGDGIYEASDVLFKVDRDAFLGYFEEYQTTPADKELLSAPEYLSLRRKICNHYPPLIAYSLHRVFNSENYKARLERLRDVWEASVYLLYAFIIAEYRFRQLKFSEANITITQLFNEGIDHRLKIIKALLDHATAEGIALRCHSLIPQQILDDIKPLNKIRNQFSHNSSLAEYQALDKFENTLPQVKDILLNLNKLEHKSLLRYVGAPGGVLKPEFEKFMGFDLQPQTYSLELEVGQLAGWSASLREKITLTIVDKDLWNLSPFVHLNLHSGRHAPDIWIFKKKRKELKISNLKGCELLFEDIASSEEKKLTGEDFRTEIQDIYALCQ